MLYFYIKVFHIISMVSWMAMLFYLPRLFVYHAENKDNKGFCDVVKIQEYKLFAFIGYPALIATIASGIGLIVLDPSIMKGGFMHAKITLVLILLAYHFSLYRYLLQFRDDKCNKSGKFFRNYNEVPTIILILITILIVLRPF
ncbi:MULTISPECIES: protoporphyrinogen oxidase HemJ [Helicobacter]|uniref:Protoporphyrinogen IX oxidase n=1 Tax=Helicobacter ibis TaxID=2962633 RepID=A0ABT4VD84_9HELI|nr:MULTISPECIES: protoporphyrinogen oxidase HemJ [Helicobacter]MDA3967271.1 protoporphyrinogen oxidase HemJ [Helicobacter sp. WB40]MDA3968661.1 protoporphyrinogen oxidase HemJ [Helicobacter ibis]